MTREEEPRYVQGEVLSEGGMGEVRRVRDRWLEREVVRKTLLWDHVGDEHLHRQFVEEALITGGLQHPGIPPVLDYSGDSTARPWITMREVRGRTFRELLESPPRDLSELRRLVALFLRVCEAMSYAHAHGVVHRDLKPDNLMVGEFGEVQVIDWGAARKVGAGCSGGAGEVIGTPGYMAPEQVAGEGVGPSADVYALGVVLAELLAGHSSPPGELVELMGDCARPSPSDRPPVHAVVERLRSWLDGTRRAEQADALVRAATAEAALHELQDTAADQRFAEAATILDRAPPHPAVSDEKRRAWALYDEGDAARRRASEHSRLMVSHLEAALVLVSEHPVAHDLLADHHRREAEAAEAVANAPLAALAEARVRLHDRGRHRAWLDGDGEVDIKVRAPADAVLCRYELRDRQLVAVEERTLGPTPLRGCRLPRGSWLLLLRRPGQADVRYPVFLRRMDRWVAPLGEPAIPLPSEGELGPEDRYVPAGWLLAGGDPGAGDAVSARRIWVRGFVARARPVTNAEYTSFLEDLLREGGDIGPFVPRQTRASAGEGEPAPMVEVVEGRVVRVDPGPGWAPDRPIVQITWFAARAYAEWLALRTGLPWRLPHALEREKMARGADGRRWPWGDYEDPVWFCNLRAHLGPPARAAVGSFPIDVSVYGIEGLAGNVRDWCANAWERQPSWPDGGVLDVAAAPAPGPLCEVRGGAWSSEPQFCRPAARFADPPTTRFGSGGFRLVRGL